MLSHLLLPRKPRGEAKKCRKVYGMEKRDMWCTACRWKKACQRFTDWFGPFPWMFSSSPRSGNWVDSSTEEGGWRWVGGGWGGGIFTTELPALPPPARFLSFPFSKYKENKNWWVKKNKSIKTQELNTGLDIFLRLKLFHADEWGKTKHLNLPIWSVFHLSFFLASTQGNVKRRQISFLVYFVVHYRIIM